MKLSLIPCASFAAVFADNGLTIIHFRFRLANETALENVGSSGIIS
jgi:hypothetical protein